MSSSVKILHNPRCSKSRQTMQLLESNGVTPDIIEYLKTPPSYEELDDDDKIRALRLRTDAHKREVLQGKRPRQSRAQPRRTDYSHGGQSHSDRAPDRDTRRPR